MLEGIVVGDVIALQTVLHRLAQTRQRVDDLALLYAAVADRGDRLGEEADTAIIQQERLVPGSGRIGNVCLREGAGDEVLAGAVDTFLLAGFECDLAAIAGVVADLFRFVVRIAQQQHVLERTRRAPFGGPCVVASEAVAEDLVDACADVDAAFFAGALGTRAEGVGG